MSTSRILRPVLGAVGETRKREDIVRPKEIPSLAGEIGPWDSGYGCRKSEKRFSWTRVSRRGMKYLADQSREGSLEEIAIEATGGAFIEGRA